MKLLGKRCERVSKTDKGFFQVLGTSLLLACFLYAEVDGACKVIDFNISVDDYFVMYIDGLPITGLQNAFNFLGISTVKISCTTRVIAILGINRITYGAIRGSDDNGLLLTNSSWKCTNISYAGWEKIDFDDSNWPDAIASCSENDPERPALNPKSQCIWTKNNNIDVPNSDIFAFCRKRLEVDECALGPPENQCDPTMGKCINTPSSYRCNCFQGYRNVNNNTCEIVSNDDRPGTYVVIILSVLLGVSLCVIILLIILLAVRQRQKNQNLSKGYNGGTDQTNATNNLGDENPPFYEGLNLDNTSNEHPYDGIYYNGGGRN